MVRPFIPEDKEKIRALCCDTGYLGQPIDRIFQDRKLFADLNTKYYLKYEPDSCFVAEADGDIIGYVLGCKYPCKYSLIFYFFIAIPLFLKAFLKCFTKRYDKKSRTYIKNIVFKGMKERPKRPKKAAHAHINIKEGFRQKGVGKALFITLLKHFWKNGVEKIYGELFHVEKLRDESFYTSHGFRVYDKKPTSILGEEWGKAYLVSVIANLNELKDLWHLKDEG